MQVRLGLPQAAKSAVAAAPLAAAIEPVRAPDFFALIGEEAHPIRETNRPFSRTQAGVDFQQGYPQASRR